MRAARRWRFGSAADTGTKAMAEWCSNESMRARREMRETAQERVTGGRWRRIVLGDVLAEHILELRGRARVWP